MRIIALISLMMVAGSLLAGTTLYRWVDDQGRVHYSDQPQPQAEEIEVAEPPTFSNKEANRGRPALRKPTTDTDASQAKDTFAGYEQLAIAAPTPDQVLWNIGGIVTVNLKVSPALRPEHKFRVTYNGSAIRDWPGSATTYQLRDVYRGTHTVAVSIIDAGGSVLAAGEPVTFHVKQTSVLN